MPKTKAKPAPPGVRWVPFAEAWAALGVVEKTLERMCFVRDLFSVVRHQDSKQAPRFLLSDELELYTRQVARHGPAAAAEDVRALRRVKGRLRKRRGP